MFEPEVTLCGYAVEDPVRRATRTGEWFATFRFASTPQRYDAEKRAYVEGETLFVTVSAYRGLRRGVTESVRNGQPLVVHGRLRIRQWTNGERSRQEARIDAITVGHDLGRGTARFTHHSPVAAQGSTKRRAGTETGVSRSDAAAGQATRELSQGTNGAESERGRTLLAPIDPAAADTDEYVVA